MKATEPKNLVWRRLNQENLVWRHLNQENLVWRHLNQENLVWRRLNQKNLVWRHLYIKIYTFISKLLNFYFLFISVRLFIHSQWTRSIFNTEIFTALQIVLNAFSQLVSVSLSINFIRLNERVIECKRKHYVPFI